MSTEHKTNEELEALTALAAFTFCACRGIKAGKVKKVELAMTLFDIAHDILHGEGVYKSATREDGETPEQEEA